MSREAGTGESDLKGRIVDFWDTQPCGAETSSATAGSREYFDEVERFRYSLERHIPSMARFGSHSSQSVLEIGCGTGTDALQFAKAGATVTAIDASRRSLEIARGRFALYEATGRFLQADAEALPFPDNQFDFAYSHGVLHHTPHPEEAVREILRVLKPSGEALVMLYHRHSYNYILDIMVLRRMGLSLMKAGVSPRLLARLTGFDAEILGKHLEMARHRGFQPDRFLSDNTDGPGNPLSRVFSRSQARALFNGFEAIRTSVRFLDKRHLPVVGGVIPNRAADAMGRAVGWHLYISARKPAVALQPNGSAPGRNA